MSKINEVAPPGWGHTKAEKEKTKPWKPKSKIGGTAAAFKRALDDGRFKGLPGDKTKKEKTASMFKLMWSMKKKGDKPHYKPGTDEKYKKYQEEETSPMPNVSSKDKGAIKKRAKNLFKRDLTGEHQSVNETLSIKDTKKLAKASALSHSDDPKDQDRARARQVEIDYKDLMRQRKKGKVGVGKSMRTEGHKTCGEGEYYCYDRCKCMPIPKGHKVREDGELVKEATTMRDNNLFGNAYAGSKRQKKKAIEAIPDKSTEVYNRNWKHKTPNNPRESVELLGADGKVAHEIIDIIKPEPMKVPESPMKWKELVEKVKLPATNGSIVNVYLTWRGRGISIKLFFPQSRTRRPTREEVNSQIQKVYPGAKVANFVESDPEPGEPFLQVGD